MDSECKIIEIIKILLADQKGIIKMAEIKMSYIFLEKEKHESKTIQKIIIEILYLICDYPHKHYTFKHFEV